jgi:Zn-dependent M28 family amino/carboxypeptidase
VIAESRKGNSDNVVMAGGHLDSVLAGPGFNDNGSGSAALLEVAIQITFANDTSSVNSLAAAAAGRRVAMGRPGSRIHAPTPR